MASGLASGADVPIEHLDYGYVSQCSDSRELEKILRVLRSGREGHYPALVKHTEKRLGEVNPKSKLLIEEQSVKSSRDLPRDQLKDLTNDFDSWAEHAEEALRVEKGEEEESELPPIRTGGTISGKTAESKSHVSKRQTSGERIKSSDYRAWDKFDADKEATKAESSMADSESPEKGTNIAAELSEKELRLSPLEKERMAVREKEKGNEAYRAGDFSEALAYYTRSVKFHPTVAAYNNRAQTALKMGRFADAVHDCSEVLELEPENTKAFMRRATARKSLKDHKAAIRDLQDLLKLDPNFKSAKELLQTLQKESGTAEPAKVDEKGEGRVGAEQLKGRRLHIVEVDSCDGVPSTATPPQTASGGRVLGQGSDEPDGAMGSKVKSTPQTKPETVPRAPSPSSTSTPSTAGPSSVPRADNEGPSSVPTSSKNNDSTGSPTSAVPPAPPEPQPTADLNNPPPLPPRVQKLKDQGNGLFRAGQYAEATEKYNSALYTLEKAGETQQPNVALLLNNRAACHLKNGNCRGCIDDCTRSISLAPLNLKALLRRAAAYDTLEKYKQAYGDYHLALRIDSSVAAAQQASSRIARLLQDELGLDWRSKLPPHPEGERVMTALSASFAPPPARTKQSPPPETANVARSETDGSSFQGGVKDRLGAKEEPSSGVDGRSGSGGVKEQGELSVEERFLVFKDRGRDHVVKGEFTEALTCYTECVKACPDKAVAYTNRAHCYLKLSQPREAEMDCTNALELEPANVKALYRRGLARKETKLYQDATKDLKTAVDLDPKNTAAKKELTLVKKLWGDQLRELQQKQKAEKKPPSSTAKTKMADKQTGKPVEKKASVDSKPKKPPAEEDPKPPPPSSSSSSSSFDATAFFHDAMSRYSGPPGPEGKCDIRELHSAVDELMKTATKEAIEKQNAAKAEREMLKARKTTYYKDEQGKKAKSQKTQVKKRKKIAIQEVEEGSSSESESEADVGRSGVDVAATATNVTEPGGKVQGKERSRASGSGGGRLDDGDGGSDKEMLASGYEFMKKWNAIPRTAQTIEYAKLLEQIRPETLPEVITNKLDDIMLTNIIRAIDKQFVPRGKYQLSIDVLQNLAKVPRFGVIAMFLGPREKQDLTSVFSAISSQTTVPVPPSTLEGLRKAYGVGP